MAQKQVVDLLAPIAQVCLGCPNPIMVLAYVDAVREYCAKTKALKMTTSGTTAAPVLTPYTTGTVTVTNGSANVVGVGTAWDTEIVPGVKNVAAGDTFTGPNGVEYTVLNVTSNTALALTAVYGGATLAGQTYSIGRSRYTSVYDLGSDNFNEVIGISAMSITGADGQSEPLTERQSSDQDGNDPADEPEFYNYIPHGQFALHPKPDAAYPLQIGLILQPLREANSVDSALLIEGDRIFRMGALAYLLMLPGQKWTDKKEGLIQRQMFLAETASMAMNVSIGHNPGALPTNRPGGNTAQPRSRIHPLS